MYDIAAIKFRGADAQTNLPVTDYEAYEEEIGEAVALTTRQCSFEAPQNVNMTEQLPGRPTCQSLIMR